MRPVPTLTNASIFIFFIVRGNAARVNIAKQTFVQSIGHFITLQSLFSCRKKIFIID